MTDVAIPNSTPPSADSDSSVIPGLQYYRAFAAAIVVLYHAAVVFGPRAYYPARSWEVVFLFGHSGVELFFVLSGFIICHAHWQRLDRPREFSSYIRKRLVRIYPPAFCVIMSWAVLRYLSHDPMTGMEWLNSLTLYPFTFAYGPPTLWTLSFELAFYALFLCAFVSRAIFLILLAIWGAAGYYLCISDYAQGLPVLLSSAYTFLFGIGALGFFVVRRLPRLSRNMLVVLGSLAVTLFSVAAYFDVQLQLQLHDDPASLAIAARKLTPLFGIAGFLAVIVLAQSQVRLSGWPHRALFFLGSASYSIYLWHLFPQRLIAHSAGGFGLAGAEQRWVVETLIIASGIGIGCLAYRYVEKPLIGRINRALRGGTQRVSGDATPAIDPGMGGGH